MGGGITELLYEAYTEEHPIDTEEIRAGFREINQTICKLTIQENDRVFALVCQLCTQQERLAFQEGLRVGVQLFLELTQRKQ